MKFFNQYNLQNLTFNGATVEPDELSYLLDIIHNVLDYFTHSNINFYLTNNPNNLSIEEKNNIVFISGQEQWGLKSNPLVDIYFTNFFVKSNEPNVVALPLGLNKFINKLILNNDIVNDFHAREFDCFFGGYIHDSRSKFIQMANKLSGNNYIYLTKRNNLQNFQGELDPQTYLNIAKKSKVQLSPAGKYHISSYRFFESIYCKNITIYEKREGQEIFKENENPLAFPINDWSDLNDDLVKWSISQFDSRIKNFEEYFRNVTSKIAVSNYIIEKIKSKVII